MIMIRYELLLLTIFCYSETLELFASRKICVLFGIATENVKLVNSRTYEQQGVQTDLIAQINPTAII